MFVTSDVSRRLRTRSDQGRARRRVTHTRRAGSRTSPCRTTASACGWSGSCSGISRATTWTKRRAGKPPIPSTERTRGSIAWSRNHPTSPTTCSTSFTRSWMKAPSSKCIGTSRRTWWSGSRGSRPSSHRGESPAYSPHAGHRRIGQGGGFVRFCDGLQTSNEPSRTCRFLPGTRQEYGHHPPRRKVLFAFAERRFQDHRDHPKAYGGRVLRDSSKTRTDVPAWPTAEIAVMGPKAP